MEVRNLTKLKVASYNIKAGTEVGYDYSIIANDIVKEEIDIVGLQEVDIKTRRNNGIDTMKVLSEVSGYKYYGFAKSIDYKGGEYGLGILSRYPIISSKKYMLESDKEQRILFHNVIDVNGKIINFFVSHLTYTSDECRDVEMRFVNDVMQKESNFILVADFNTDDFSLFDCVDKCKFVNNSDFTMPSFIDTNTAIDNIVMSDCFSYTNTRMQTERHSDHHMIMTDIVY